MASNGDFPGLEFHWHTHRRWEGIERPYKPEDVARLRGSIHIEHTLARLGSERLWQLVKNEPYVSALGAMTGNQAIQQVRAGLKAIYVSGWQVAADNNLAGEVYPDQSLYPANSVPEMVRRINRALMRADQIYQAEGRDGLNWFVPLVADAEAGFGGVLNAFELTKALIEAGAAAVHFEDQLSSAKKCGHMGGKVLVSTQEGIQKLVAARLAADVMGIPTVIIARTDADSAKLLTSDIDPRDHDFIQRGARTYEGFFRYHGGPDAAISRSLSYAPYADMLWWETAEPNLEEARRFAEAIHSRFPDKILAYNCSPSFNWRKKLSDQDIARFIPALGEMGYKFQFITLAGFHSLNLAMFELARGFRDSGMAAYTRLQEKEFSREREYGYDAVKHQRFVGTGYFDEVQMLISGGLAATTALTGSTEDAQFLDGSGAPEKTAAGPDATCQPVLGECPTFGEQPLVQPISHPKKEKETAA
jgi:isocitrate lyase